jgi:hypothetical protein
MRRRDFGDGHEQQNCAMDYLVIPDAPVYGVDVGITLDGPGTGDDRCRHILVWDCARTAV